MFWKFLRNNQTKSEASRKLCSLKKLLWNFRGIPRAYLWISASDVATLKKSLVEVKPPQSWPWKQNGTTVVAAMMILELVSIWRSVLQINIWKKSYTLNPNHLLLQEMYVTITILEWLQYFSNQATESFFYFPDPTFL